MNWLNLEVVHQSFVMPLSSYNCSMCLGILTVQLSEMIACQSQCWFPQSVMTTTRLPTSNFLLLILIASHLVHLMCTSFCLFADLVYTYQSQYVLKLISRFAQRTDYLINIDSFSPVCFHLRLFPRLIPRTSTGIGSTFLFYSSCSSLKWATRTLA